MAKCAEEQDLARMAPWKPGFGDPPKMVSEGSPEGDSGNF